MGVSRQGYYDWRKRFPSRTTLRHEFLKSESKRVFYEHKGRYGSPRIAQQLYDEGIETNKRVVAVLMRELNLCAKGFHHRKPSYGKEKAIEQVIKENLLNRQFNQSQIDAIWVTAIPYISCADGRLYLSTYIDLATRILRCYKVDAHMRKEIVIQPLERYNGSLLSVVHSERGLC